MKTSRSSFIVIGLVGLMGVSACNYATKSDVDELRKELYATQDSVTRLWSIARQYSLKLMAFDTIRPPPKCPGDPRCPLTEVITQPPFPPPPEWNKLRGQAH